MRLERLPGLAVRREEDVDQEFVRHADVLGLALRRFEPGGIEFLGALEKTEGANGALAVLARTREQQIDVFRAAQEPVQAHRMTADEDVADAFLMESPEQPKDRIGRLGHRDRGSGGAIEAASGLERTFGVQAIEFAMARAQDAPRPRRLRGRQGTIKHPPASPRHVRARFELAAIPGSDDSIHAGIIGRIPFRVYRGRWIVSEASDCDDSAFPPGPSC